MTPSFTAAAVYDDDIFADPSERRDAWLGRFAPALQAVYQARPTLTFTGAFSSDAEVFPEFPEQNRFFARRRASVGLQSRLGRTTNLSLALQHALTRTPRDLAEETDLQFRRGRAEGYAANVGLNRRFGPHHTFSLGYRFRRLGFGEGEHESRDSQAWSVGWTFDVARATTFSLDAGPRYSEGITKPHGRVSVSHRLRQGSLTLSYAWGRNLVPSEAREVSTLRLSADTSRQIGRRLQVSVSPSYARNYREDRVSTVYRIQLGATYPIKPWLAAQGSYRLSLQRGTLLSPGMASADREEIVSNIAWVGLSVFRSYRLR